MTKLKKKVDRLLDDGLPGSIEEAKNLLTKEASNSNVEAQLLLVQFIFEYESENAPDALGWLTRAAANGSGQAAYQLARLYRETEYYPVEALKRLTPSNAQESKKWLEEAYRLGYFEAKWEYASAFFNEKKFDQAIAAIKELKTLKSSDFPEDKEAVQQIKQLAREMELNIKELASVSKLKDLADQNPATLRPEQLYNTALLLLESDNQKAMRLLKMAADKGLVAARKKIEELSKGVS